MNAKKIVIIILLLGSMIIGSVCLSRSIWRLGFPAQTQGYHVGAREQLKPRGASSSEYPQEGRRRFVDPKGRFSFQYKSDGSEYGIEMNSPDIFSVCDALNCYFVGVEVNPLSMEKNGEPEYDYIRLTYDRKFPDSLEAVEWNGYSAYRATFAWKEYPERILFIHIPYNGQLFTLFRSTIDSEENLRQFGIISETFRFL